MNHRTGNTEPKYRSRLAGGAALALGALLVSTHAMAQVPVDAEGNPIALETSVIGPAAIENPTVQSDTDYDAGDLEALIGPIALYPDDLLAIVLPAATYPLEIVQAARFLEQREANPNLEPDEAWDDSIIALLNYPDVVQLMNDDLDWTWQLGDAVVRQQADVVLAIETFRDRAFAAGNLESDDYQNISRGDSGAIEIESAQDDVIYVPYYEPEKVVYESATPVYHYYPRPYPVYYYPYPSSYRFTRNAFWGVTTAYTIGWSSNYLHVYHPSYRGHPYYGYNYAYHGYWRRPSINVYNTWYVNPTSPQYRYRHYRGDYWRPREHRSGARPTTRVVNQRYNNRSASPTVNRASPSTVTFRARPDNRESGARRNDQAMARSINRRNASAIADSRNRAMPGRVASRNSARSSTDSVGFRSRSGEPTNTNRLNNRATTRSSSQATVNQRQSITSRAGRVAGGDRGVRSQAASSRSTGANGNRRSSASIPASRQAQSAPTSSRSASRSSVRSRSTAAPAPRSNRSAAPRSSSRPTSARSSSRSSGQAVRARSSSSRTATRSRSSSRNRPR